MVYFINIFPHTIKRLQLQVNIKNLIDDAQCYDTVRSLRWKTGIECPFCESKKIIKRGVDDKEKYG